MKARQASTAGAAVAPFATTVVAAGSTAANPSGRTSIRTGAPQAARPLSIATGRLSIAATPSASSEHVAKRRAPASTTTCAVGTVENGYR